MAAQILEPTVDVVATSMSLDSSSAAGRGPFSLQESVDVLQDMALSTGLVDLLGQDAVQSFMAEAFERRRGRTC